MNSGDGKLYQSLVDANTAPLSDTKSWFFFTDGKYVPFSGGTITGSLTIQKDLTVNGTNAIRNPTASKLALETDDANKNGFIFQQVNDVLRLGTSKNGVLSDTLAFFNSTNKNIDFSANVLSQNKVRIMNDNDFISDSSQGSDSGYIKLPGNLIIQWKSGTFHGRYNWPKNFKSWVVATTSFGVTYGSENTDFNFFYDKNNFNVTYASNIVKTNIIAIGDF